jgi:CRISPR/Cas system-associated exonuclease Cas4 (RecB family)
MATERTVKANMLPDHSEGFSPTEFIDRYEQVYKSGSNRSGFKTKKSFAPSKLGYDKGEGVCPRYWYIAFSGANFVEEIDSRSQANMDNGSYAHERIQKNMQAMGIVKAIEKEINSVDPPIRGFIDVIIDWNGQEIPGEIKTANADNFTFRVASGKPTGSHYVQFIIYMKVLRAKEGFLLYENKDTQELAILRVHATPKVVADAEFLFEWMKRVRKSFEDKELPVRPWTRANAAICKKCPVREDCFDEEKFGVGTVSLPVLEVPKP